jgi:hypothetical protein
MQSQSPRDSRHAQRSDGSPLRNSHACLPSKMFDLNQEGIPSPAERHIPASL